MPDGRAFDADLDGKNERAAVSSCSWLIDYDQKVMFPFVMGLPFLCDRVDGRGVREGVSANNNADGSTIRVLCQWRERR